MDHSYILSQSRNINSKTFWINSNIHNKPVANQISGFLDLFGDFFSGNLESREVDSLVTNAINSGLLFDNLSKVDFEQYFLHLSKKIKSNDLKMNMKRNSKKFTPYYGRAPILNGSYYCGSHTHGGVLGDIIVYIEAREFASARNKLVKLKSSKLPIQEVVDELVGFFTKHVLESYVENSSKLQKTYKISKKLSIIPLSMLIYLGHGDCRAHALSISALLNYFGIQSEYANYRLMELENGIIKTLDHSFVIYKKEDKKEYIADSYFYDLNSHPLIDLLNGVSIDSAGGKYKFIVENKFPIIYVRQ